MGMCIPAESVLLSACGFGIAVLAPQLHAIAKKATRYTPTIGKLSGSTDVVRWGGYVHLIRAVGVLWFLAALVFWWAACAVGA